MVSKKSATPSLNKRNVGPSTYADGVTGKRIHMFTRATWDGVLPTMKRKLVEEGLFLPDGTITELGKARLKALESK